MCFAKNFIIIYRVLNSSINSYDKNIYKSKYSEVKNKNNLLTVLPILISRPRQDS